MKRFIILIIALIITTGVYSQISEGGFPPSYDQAGLKSIGVIPTLQLKYIEINKLSQEDKANGTPMRYGVVEETELDIKTGLETEVDLGTIWRYEIDSDNAKSIKLLFSDFIIPEGAQLFLYNTDYSVIYGAFTNANMNSEGTFAIADFPGNKLIVEYFEPSDAEFSGYLQIDRISKAYLNLEELQSSGSSAGDYLDVNCEKGIEWQLEKHAVCLYSFIQNDATYLCSGALINTVNQDGTPYFLTANHCISTQTEASSITVYFNYETLACGLGKKADRTLSGAKLITMGSGSDFTLLEFNTVPPAAYQPYYAGWDLTDSATSTVGIHHPEGLLKKISIDNDPPETYGYSINWDQNEVSKPDTHWQIFFDKGHTSSGSSGSPLFNQNRRIIGQLHGGGDIDDYYGKLNYSWNHVTNGRNTNYSNLSKYLAGSSSITSLDGYTPATNTPDAIFTASAQYACIGAPIQFIDYSLFNVEEWTWIFSPTHVTFLDSTTANSQNPVVSFNAAGNYTVKLVVKNSVGKDSITISSLIRAGSKIAVSFDASVDNGTCLSSVDSVVISAKGANNYSWELTSGSPYFEINELDNSMVSIRKDAGFISDSTVYLKGIIVGTQGTCTDTSNFSLKLSLPSNDDIANATFIEPGANGPFTNECAGIQTNEPVPPFESCTTQADWCDEYGTGEDIVEHSVWFYFYGPQSGYVSIKADSMDGQIALYDAYSYADILNGDYTILGANDDISDTDPFSKIKTVKVTPGKMYWIQFDGSGGGTEGTFYIRLNEEHGVSVKELTAPDDEVILFPQPASDYLTVRSTKLVENEALNVKIYSTTGALVYNGQASSEQGKVLLNLESVVPNGMYILSITGNNLVINKSFVKEAK